MQPHPESPLPARLHAAARRLLQERRPAEALPMLDRLALIAPGGGPLAGPVAALRAEALAGLGQWPAAEAAADAALAADPAPATLALRARIRRARGDAPGAVDDAAAAVMARPWDMASKVLLGTALLDIRRFDEAIWFLGEALTAEPDEPGHKYRLGRAFMLAGRHPAAAELLANCAETAPNTPGLAALRAQNCLLSGNPAGAVALAGPAIAAGGEEAALHSVLAHALIGLGRIAEAAPHLTAASRLAPDNGYLAHLAASAAGRTAERATPEYVATLFDSYAARFEDSLIALQYRVPGLIRRAVERQWPAVASGVERLGPVLDLGCGTGLVGVTLADFLGGPLDGVDLSAGMLREAAAKRLYTSLHHADLAAALRADATPRALITAADVFIYLGALEEVLGLCRTRLAPGGVLVFSAERAADGAAGWELTRFGRFAHTPDYLRSCLAGAGLTALEWREEALRSEADGPAAGLVIVAGATGH